MSINFSHLLSSFPVMGMGMLGIFVVMMIIYLVTFVVSRVGKKG